MSGSIEYIEKNDEKDISGVLNPLVLEWFFGKFSSFSETQLYGVKRIYDRRNILVSAPTGGTKTLTAFLGILNYIVDLALKDELEEKIYSVYVSPLKALSNDIFVNLVQPLEEMKKLAYEKGLKMQDIRVGLRTGDTDAKERAKMARNTPHIFVTTPESLAIVLTTKKFVENLRALEFVVVDEIHALTNKRGVYLSLTLERLVEESLIEPVRIGLSATIAPLEEIAKFLVGTGRDCDIARVKLDKDIEIDLDFPGDNILEAEGWDSQNELYEILNNLIEKHKTVLIFTNTRAGTERIVHHLEDRFPGKYSDKIGAHHSSMSKEERFKIEEKLRNGELKVAVSSTSLELGIDIGNIDLVILLKSPKSVSRALQRIGRAGHKLYDHPRGMFIVLDRDDLVECGVLMKNMIEKKIEKTFIPKNALDVLAQQIYGMAISKICDVNKMLKVIRRSYCYSELKRNDFYDVVSYLAGDYALEHRHVYAKIWYNGETGEVGKKGKLARVMYMTNIGTIPSESFIEVKISFPAERRGESVGKIDEGFLERMRKGDVFVLGGKKYQFLYTKGMKAFVRADVSKNPTIPSWFSEMLPLSFDVALDIGHFRRLVKGRLVNRSECIEFIQKQIYCKKSVAEEIFNYFNEQDKFSEIPTDEEIVIEKFEEDGKEFLLFHTLYGRRVNDVLSRAYRYAARRLKIKNVSVGINDNGFFIRGDKLDRDKILDFVKSNDLIKIMGEAIEGTDVLKRRFRHCASRSLMILRSYKGRSKSVGKQQIHSEFLYRAVKKISNEFPILREARREVLEDMMDLENAKRVLELVEEGKIKIKKVNLGLVSPFGLGLIIQGRSDLIKIEDKISFLKRMHELHLKGIGGKDLKMNFRV